MTFFKFFYTRVYITTMLLGIRDPGHEYLQQIPVLVEVGSFDKQRAKFDENKAFSRRLMT